MDGLQSDVTRDIISISNLKYVQRQPLISEEAQNFIKLVALINSKVRVIKNKVGFLSKFLLRNF
jgi:hypothetical protein